MLKFSILLIFPMVLNAADLFEKFESSLKKKWTKLQMLRVYGDITDAKFVPEESKVVLAIKYKKASELYLWDFLNCTHSFLGTHRGFPARLEIENNQLEVKSPEGIFSVWDLSEGKMVGDEQICHFEKHYIATRGDGNQTAQIDGRALSIKDLQTGIMDRIKFPENLSSFAYSPDNKTSAVGLDDGRVQIFNSVNRTPGNLLADHSREITSLNFDSEGSRLVSTCEDELMVWQNSAKTLLKHFSKIEKPEELYLIWLLLGYQEFLKEFYPERSCIRIQDAAQFSCAVGLETTVEKLTAIAQNMPFDVEWALIRYFNVYDRSDSEMNKDLTQIRARKRRRHE